MGQVIDELGHKYGRLTVVRKDGINVRMKATWLCKCECGNQIVVTGTNLRSNNTKSCGCLNKEKASERMKTRALPTGEAAFNKIFGDLRRLAKRRKHEWQLTKEQFHTLTQQTCYYCDAEPNQGRHLPNYNGVYIYNGLDRVDNTKGYTIDNVVPCCGTCNKAKNTQTTEEFKTWICRIYKHFCKDPDFEEQ